MATALVESAVVLSNSFRTGNRKEVIKMSFYGGVNSKGRDIMTLDDAIRHCYNVARTCTMFGKEDCGKDHLQLAEWLEDYKRLKRAVNGGSMGY